MTKKERPSYVSGSYIGLAIAAIIFAVMILVEALRSILS